jgi:hypothetical protein
MELIKANGKKHTDSTHVVAAVTALGRLELAEKACGPRWRRWQRRTPRLAGAAGLRG